MKIVNGICNPVQFLGSNHAQLNLIEKHAKQETYCLFWAAAGFSILARLDSLFFMAPLGFYYMYHCRDKICWSLWFSSMVLVFLFYGYLESIFSVILGWAWGPTGSYAAGRRWENLDPRGQSATNQIAIIQ